jgi:hypothetical protein
VRINGQIPGNEVICCLCFLDTILSRARAGINGVTMVLIVPIFTFLVDKLAQAGICFDDGLSITVKVKLRNKLDRIRRSSKFNLSKYLLSGSFINNKYYRMC